MRNGGDRRQNEKRKVKNEKLALGPMLPFWNGYAKRKLFFNLHFSLFIFHFEFGGPHKNRQGSQAEPPWLPQGADYAGTNAADICCKAA